MIARKLSARGWSLALVLAALAPGLAGCSILNSHEADKIPQLGIVDPNQPRELEMVSMPPYVVEPPDELEVSVRPASLDLSPTTVVVQPEGIVDLGFWGEVYVAGLTLPQVELKLAQHFAAVAAQRRIRVQGPIEVSARLINGSQSKSYYVLGTVSTQGKFPITGNDTVLDAILTAGLRTNSLPEKAYLVRPHPAGGADQVLRIEWERITKGGDTLSNYQVFPGDRIIVPGTKAPGLLGSLLGGG